MKGTKNIKIKVGVRFGKLLVIENLGNSQWRCECLCGEIETIKTKDLLGHLSNYTTDKYGDARGREYKKLII